MSLVAYETSSEEENDAADGSISEKDHTLKNIHDDEEYRDKVNGEENVNISKEESKTTGISFAILPSPKKILPSTEVIEEVDDEYLHKKVNAQQAEKTSVFIKATTVKITIPSLSEFKDLDTDNKKTKVNIGPCPKTCGLLNMLPKPKQQEVFSKSDLSQGNNLSVKKSLIPDSVKNHQTTKTSKALPNAFKPQVKKSLVSNISDSEDSDSDDFFSLNSKQELPEVSLNEINSLVAKKAAQMAETTAKYEKIFSENTESNESTVSNDEEMKEEEVKFDEKALQMLVGSQAKRRKVEVNVVELSSAQVLPNKDEWLRSTLAQATTYQAKGVLVDEEPAPGTRKKHQITYLAHQAKANEQELQAMWAANRHTRRQTQSKYGF